MWLTCDKCARGTGQHAEWCTVKDQSAFVDELTRRECLFPSVIDSTMLNCFRTCPRKFYWEYIRRRVPRGLNINLLSGSAFAAGLEIARRAFYVEGRSQDDSLAMGLRRLWQDYGEPEVKKYEVKTWDRVSQALVSYCDEYPFATDPLQPWYKGSIPAIEFTFALPIDILHPETDEPLILAGRCDMLGQFRSSGYIVDEKTTKALGMNWARKWDMRAQFKMYGYAAREHGFSVKGAIVRGVGILKQSISHAQAIIYFSDWDMARWLEQTHRTIQAMIHGYHEDYWDYDLGESCAYYGGCSFQPLCIRQNPEPWVEILTEKNTWNPLRKLA